MEAKDTVMGDMEISEAIIKGTGYEANPLELIKDGYLHDGHRGIAKTQAEVSFKAGMRKVAGSLDWEGTSYEDGRDGSPIMQVMISKAEWEANLKEWGIDE